MAFPFAAQESAQSDLVGLFYRETYIFSYIFGVRIASPILVLLLLDGYRYGSSAVYWAAAGGRLGKGKGGVGAGKQGFIHCIRCIGGVFGSFCLCWLACRIVFGLSPRVLSLFIVANS